MKCILIVCAIMLSFVVVCTGTELNCRHTFRRNDPSVQNHCIYAQLENKTHLQMCDYDDYYTYNLPEYPASPMGECVKAPGYLKFMRCNTDWCNTECFIPTEDVILTTEQTTVPTVSSTTITPTTTNDINTTHDVTVSATKLEISSSTASTMTNNGTIACQKNGQDLDRSDKFPLTNVFANKQVNVVYNIPTSQSGCECRCNQDKAQNSYVAL